MILYLTEDVINEAVSGSEVVDAINNRKAVLINYADKNASHTGKRYIEPYVYGVTKAGNPCIRAYQYWGDTKRGVPKWKLFRLDRVQSWEPTEDTFELEPKARGWAAQAYNNNGDGSMAEVYQTVELGAEPQTDYERLKARTRQIKNSKPININNVDLKQNTTKQKPQTQRAQAGPVGNQQPVNKIQSPVEPEQKTQQEPLNTDIDNKPVEQEPNVDGPVVNEPVNAQNSSADELMSNDEFRKMLQRNLDITNQEKQRRLNRKNQSNLK